jgi:predicted lysophospholipase L1 biosynthesis ABC-type transport system permease subunit
MLVAYGCGFGALAALLLWQAADIRLGAYVIGGFTVAVAAFVGVAWLLLRLLSHAAVTSRVARQACATVSPSCGATRQATPCKPPALRSG